MVNVNIRVQEGSGAKIREWSPSRVDEFLTDFAERNELKLRTPVPQVSGEILEKCPCSTLLVLFFEEASDVDVLNLFFEIHPTEVTLDLSCFS